MSINTDKHWQTMMWSEIFLIICVWWLFCNEGKVCDWGFSSKNEQKMLLVLWQLLLHACCFLKTNTECHCTFTSQSLTTLQWQMSDSGQMHILRSSATSTAELWLAGDRVSGCLSSSAPVLSTPRAIWTQEQQQDISDCLPQQSSRLNSLWLAQLTWNESKGTRSRACKSVFIVCLWIFYVKDSERSFLNRAHVAMLCWSLIDHLHLARKMTNGPLQHCFTLPA